MQRIFTSLAFLGIALVAAACDGSSTADSTASGGGNDGTGGQSTTPADRGPTVLDIDGDSNGLFWSDADKTLYVAEDNGNRILQWKDGSGFALVANLPAAAPEGAGLGQLVKTADGTIVVTRFGGGTAGDVAFVRPDGTTAVVPGLDPERRRIGLTAAADGTLYDCWFVRLSSGDRLGSVGTLALTGSEPEVITGLQKPVGVVAIGDSLYVSDQDLGQILKAPLSNPSSYQVLAEVEGPDLIAAGPDGSIFTGSIDGNVYRVDAAGNATVFKTGFQAVRGVAYDPTNRRLFVADHDEDESDGVTHYVHILPVD